MNVALIALQSSGEPLAPPLALAYIATLLEEQRYIVRIYDLALKAHIPIETALRPLYAFAPQIVIVAGSAQEQLGQVHAIAHELHCQLLPICIDRTSIEVDAICAEVMAWISRVDPPQAGAKADPTSFVIDRLPFPARHLLSLESYPLRASGGELQTTLLVGVPQQGRFMLRSPTQIIGELRSVSREYGLRHYLFPGIELTRDRAWFYELLIRLRDADLGIRWEGQVAIDQLDKTLLAMMSTGGCEAVYVRLNALQVFESADARHHLTCTVDLAHAAGITVRACLELEPPYESIPALVDVAATFGLDVVDFSITKKTGAGHPVSDTARERQIEEMAVQIYSTGRKRQDIIDRYGPIIGGLIWRLRTSGFLSKSDSPSSAESG